MFASLQAALQPWQNFFLLVGTAAATLTGLMFVAVNFGSSLITRETAVMARAFLDPVYQHFVQVLVTACAMTVPVLDASVAGALCVAWGVCRIVALRHVYAQYKLAHKRRGDMELSDWLRAIVLPLLCHVGLLVVGAGFVAHDGHAVTGLAVVTLMLLVIGIHDSWELFVWMALAVAERRRIGEPSPPPESAK
jgi:hypothetical protein